MTDIPQITALPDPPQRGQDPALFIQRADTFIDALPGLVDDFNAFGPALIDATTERVADEAADSFAGAMQAKVDAQAARDQAQAAAAAIDPNTLVHRTGAETLAGVKTFSSAPVFSAGIKINGQTLDEMTAAGVALLEAADAAAQKTALGIPTALVQDFTGSGTWTKQAGAKAVRIIMWGGGGGGGPGYYAGGNSAGGGGTGAAYMDVTMSADDLAATVNVTIGAGGAGGVGAYAAGGAGGSTTFGSLSAAGGTGQPGNGDLTYHTPGGMFPGGYGGKTNVNWNGGEGWMASGGSSGDMPIYQYQGGRAGSPCPGGGAGRVEPNGNNQPAGNGGLGALRGPTAFFGQGGAASVNNLGAASATGSNGAPRVGSIPGSGGGGGSISGGVGYPGGNGGPGAGGGGGAGAFNGSGKGGDGGVGFCRVITFF